MITETPTAANVEVPRQEMAVDIACVGFGPAMGGFLTTITKELASESGAALQSTVMPGMRPQVICYERADDIGQRHGGE